MALFGQSSQLLLGLVIEAEDRASGVIRGIGSSLESVIRSGAQMAVWGAAYQILGGIENGLSSMVSQMVMLNATAESFHATLLSLYRDPALAQRADTFITQFATQAPATLEQTRAAAIEAASAGLDITKVMKDVGNAAAAMNTDIGTGMHALVTAIYGDTTVLRDQLHIMPNDLVAFGLKIDNTGHIMTNTLVPAFEKFVNANYPDAMSKQMKTASGEFSNLEDAWHALEREIGKPIFAVLKKDMENLLSWLSDNKTTVQEWADNVGNALATGVAAVSIAVPHAIQLVGTVWDKMKDKATVVGDFFDKLGSGIHNATRTVMGTIYDMVTMFTETNKEAINQLIELLNKAGHAMYDWSGGKLGLGPDDGGVPEFTLATPEEIARNRAKFLNEHIGPVAGDVMDHRYASGGGGGDLHNPAIPGMPGSMGQGKLGGGWADSHAKEVDALNPDNKPLDVPGRGNFTDPIAERARLQKIIDEARKQFQLDLASDASAATLKVDVARIASAMRAPLLQITPLDVRLETKQDQQTIMGHIVGNLQKQFQTDQDARIRNPVTLRHDMDAILAAMREGGAPAIDIALEQAKDLKLIAGNTKIANPVTIMGAVATNQQAGFGQTLAAFGMPQRDQQAQTIANLTRQLAAMEQRAVRDERQIDLLREQLTALHAGNRYQQAAAANTAGIAAELGAVTIYRDPRKGRGLTVSR